MCKSPENIFGVGKDIVRIVGSSSDICFLVFFISTIFSDAPALSRDDALAAAPSDPNGTESPDVNDEGDQWDEEALAASLTRKGAVTATSNTTELLDMKASRSEQGNIAEKLRVEETKAKLKAAKEGMEKEAQRLKEEKEKERSCQL